MTDLQKHELQILVVADDYFKKNKIDYFLCGGTLLGSIRHKGFIPWDDDIDIGLLRKDYLKLLEIAKNNPMINEKTEIQLFELRKFQVSNREDC